MGLGLFCPYLPNIMLLFIAKHLHDTLHKFSTRALDFDPKRKFVSKVTYTQLFESHIQDVFLHI